MTDRPTVLSLAISLALQLVGFTLAGAVLVRVVPATRLTAAIALVVVVVSAFVLGIFASFDRKPAP